MVSVFFAVMELFQSAVITAIRSYHLPAGKGRSAGVWSGVDGSAVGFAEFLWGVAGSLAEVVAEGGSVPEAAGESCFCDGAGGGAEKLGCHLEAVFQEILFWGGVFMFHEDPVKIGTVDSYVVCHV